MANHANYSTEFDAVSQTKDSRLKTQLLTQRITGILPTDIATKAAWWVATI